jgi:ketosteroid isomerase-like protein
MSHKNVEVTVQQFEGTNARDFAGVMDMWAEDVTLIIHSEAWERSPRSNTATGKGAVAALWSDWCRQFGPDYRFDIEELLRAGDRVLVVARHHAHQRHSGVTVEQSTAFVYTLHEGKVSRIELWADYGREAALEGVGERE